MKFFMLLSLLLGILHAKIYYAKVEPYEIRDISSNVSGLVLSADPELVGTTLGSDPYIQIDAEIDKKDLIATKKKLHYAKNSLETNEAILVNLNDLLVKKRENYRRIEPLKFKSKVEKDREFYDLITSENLYLNTRKEVQNLKSQIADLELKAAQLQRSIRDKNLTAEGFVLYEMLVKPGQVVNFATPLAKIADTSRAILTLYLDEEDAVEAKESVIYIDEKKTSYKVSRLLNIADGVNISKYMAQVVIKSPKLFSRLVKVELKNE